MCGSFRSTGIDMISHGRPSANMPESGECRSPTAWCIPRSNGRRPASQRCLLVNDRSGDPAPRHRPPPHRDRNLRAGRPSAASTARPARCRRTWEAMDSLEKLPQVGEGALRAFLVSYKAAPLTLHAVYPPTQHLAVKARLHRFRGRTVQRRSCVERESLGK
jgi:hypothetical protein